ncbi:MAG: YihY/virulence factor BrkB family protein [bacterium]
MKKYWKFLQAVIREWQKDNAQTLAAALAYYAVFSLAPLLLIIIAIVGMVLSRDQVLHEVIGAVNALLGVEVGRVVSSLLNDLSNRNSSIIATVVGVITLLIGATGIISQLQNSFNVIWDAKPKSKTVWFRLVKKQIFSLGYILLLALLLLLSLLLNTALNFFLGFLTEQYPTLAFILPLGSMVLTFLLTWLLFVSMFTFIPDAKVHLHDALVGGGFTALLFLFGRMLLTWYLTKGVATSAYGAAGALVAILLWVYTSSEILFLGAEFTKVYGKIRSNTSSK